ncbi:unnamed protein product [Rotaria magnacalcarata]|uniref:Uncharacterized protein n=1 Tax=Rotaria magnacalcarata TaxID=392030 RepID=A0A816VP09_9BILA|nr:unnamed protein product [Rotaria magnacalcarata]CAF2123165.1 unnamed protein product [Rotaria magnacalcarata]
MASSNVVILSICALILLLCNCVSSIAIDQVDVPCSGVFVDGSVQDCAAEIVHRVWKIHHWSTDIPINVCDVSCIGNIKGRFSKLQWMWDVRFRCDSKAPAIIGYAIGKSRSIAMHEAIQDFISKATITNYAKVQDFQC